LEKISASDRTHNSENDVEKEAFARLIDDFTGNEA